MSSATTYLIATQDSGQDFPAVMPAGTTLLAFRHNERGATSYLYEFQDDQVAPQVAALVRGRITNDLALAWNFFDEEIEANRVE